MQLVEVKNIFTLKQYIKGQMNQEDIDSNIAKTGTSIWEQKQNLVEEMGTQKAKRKVQQMQSNIIKAENIAFKTEMSELLSGKQQELKQKFQNEEDQKMQELKNQKQEFLPEFNLETSEVDKIYNLNSIITPEEMDAISVDALVVALKKNRIEQELQKMHVSDYVHGLLANFNQKFAHVQKGRSVLLKRLLYLDFYIKLSSRFKFQSSSMEEIAKQCGIDLIFIKQFLQKFYQASPVQENQILYIRSQSLKDKFICYALVLALSIFDFKMDGSALALGLKIDKRKIIDYARDVGCNVRVVDDEQKSDQISNQNTF